VPNIFGGDQFHPAYMPQELPEGQFVVGNIHYRVDMEKRVVNMEAVNGSAQTIPLDYDSIPQVVKDYIKKRES
jgi:hypothetical protein